MKTSIIISTYNRPEALQRVVNALDEQTRPPDEVIIADDGSTQTTQACIAAMTRRLSLPIVHVWQPDLGFRLSLVRNKAVLAAKGDYLVFLDGDCIPDPHFVQDHCHLAGQGFFVQGKRVLVDREWTAHFTHAHIKNNRVRLLLSAHLSNRHHLLRMNWLPAITKKGLSGIRGCNLALFRQDIVAVNGFNQSFEGWGREDSEFVARLYQYGLKRREHPFAAICFHLWHPEQARAQLSANDQLLAQTIASHTYECKNGLNTLSSPVPDRMDKQTSPGTQG